MEKYKKTNEKISNAHRNPLTNPPKITTKNENKKRDPYKVFCSFILVKI